MSLVNCLAIIPTRNCIKRLPKSILKELKAIVACKVGSEDITMKSDSDVFLFVDFARYRGNNMNSNVSFIKIQASNVVLDSGDWYKC